MEKEVRCFIILAALMANLHFGFSQDFSSPPPEPMITTQDTTSDCGSGDGGDGSGVPPPVGLCLPINDYLLPLLISGVALGAGSLFRIHTKLTSVMSDRKKKNYEKVFRL
ncbi:hypothetical protein [Salinimicrobium xinjiangense]|uniref:hypothetical protein n=1 Tax=Salinimicrobium xinjiangense TaxID=438596 RepID=UPI00049152E2|nr:hypothetical protein [Salinimicrobium xinjiangense]